MPRVKKAEREAVAEALLEARGDLRCGGALTLARAQ